MSKPNVARAFYRSPHETRVLQTLLDHGALTRGELCARLGVSRTTLSELTASLLARGAIVESAPSAPAAGRGRPAHKLALDPHAGQFIGVDFGHRRVRCAVVNASHQIVAAGVESYDMQSDWPERITLALALIDRVSAEANVHLDAVHGVGLGFPGPFSTRLPNAHELPIAVARREGAAALQQAFTDRFATRVVLDNNTRLAGLAEAIWDGAGIDNLLYVRISDGIGGGIVVDGQVLSGGFGFAGEFGHIRVPGRSAPCRCGKRGCLETIASRDAIIARCAKDDSEITTLTQVARRAATGDPAVLEVLRDAGTALGHVLGAAALSVNPREIVIGGDVAELSPVFIAQAASTIRYELLPVAEAMPEVRPARLGDEGGAIGAAAVLFAGSSTLSSELTSQLSTEPTRQLSPELRTTQRSTPVHTPLSKARAW